VKAALTIYALMSAITFITYGLDKRAAVHGQRRISERALHGLDLLGGFPGGFAAQHCFRHKRRKGTFQVVFWLTAAVHAAGWWLWFRAR
jgi:uncharacterized membrane protein YsdA (DUF1294 family)